MRRADTLWGCKAVAALHVGLCTTTYPAGIPDLRTFERFAERGEELGFDSLWVVDHIAYYTAVPDPIVLLGAFMAWTTRVRLGTAITLLPLRNATILAKAVATLDNLSGGRVMLGVGVGGEYPKEFEAVGVPVSERGRRADEAIEVMRRLWTDDPASYEGRYYRFSDVNLEPKPAQRGGPPLWIGGRSEAAFRRTARYGDGWLGYFMTPERVRESRAKIDEAARAVGRDPARIGLGILVYPVVSENEAWAREQAAFHLGRQYNRVWDAKLLDRYVPTGSPARCIEKMAALVQAGVKVLVIQPIVPVDMLLDQVERLGREVLPELRKL